MDAERFRGRGDARQGQLAQQMAEHRPMLHALAMRCCRHDHAIAEDLVQDTLERAWRNIESLHDRTKVLPWLVTILRHCWIDVCRRRSVVQAVGELPDHSAPIEEQESWQRVTVDDFHRAIDQLDEPYRSVAIMHDIDQLPNAEIARRLAIPYATVATRLHRAHQKLRRLLRATLDSAEGD